MAYPLLHAADVGLPDHARAEGVAQVVEAQWPQPRRLDRGVVAPAQRRAVDVAAELADEDQVVVVGGMPTVPEPCQRGRDLGCHWHRPHLAAPGRR
jgi:hypothetical protein